MKRYSIMEHWLGKLAFAGLLISLLLLARDTLISTSIVGFAKAQFRGLGILGGFGLVFLLVNYKQLKQIVLDKRVGAMLLTAALILLPMPVKRDWQMMYFSILLCPLTAIFITYFTDVRETARYYVVILAVLCVHSVVSLIVLKRMVFAGMLTVNKFPNPNNWWFLNFGLSFVVDSMDWHRNFGIFREPGVYQFFILLALYLNNYKADWKYPAVTWVLNGILAATMVSTFAIGGLIETFLLAVFLYFDKQWHRTPLGKRLGIVAAAVGAVAVGFVVYKVNQPGSEGTFWFDFKDLYLRLFTGSESLFDRLDAIFVSARLFLDRPIFGDTIANVLHGTEHNTSSTLILYAVLGVLGGSLNVAAWVALAWEKRRGIVGNLLLLVILFMSFNTQNLVADLFLWLFPYMALAEVVLPRIPGKKA